MYTSIMKSLVLAALLLAAGAMVRAQPVGGEPGSTRALVDGVAAVVGNEVILISDVRSMALQQSAATHANPEDPAYLRGILDAMISEKLLLAKAREDSVTVTDDEVAQLVDRQYAYLLERCRGSVACIEKTYGMSTEGVKKELRALLRDQALSQRVQQRKVSGIRVTDNDVQEFFGIYRDSIPEIPEQIELQRIVLLNKPTAQAKQRAVDLAERIIDSLTAGGDFADFAKRYSADPGSAASGGDVGFVEPGRFVSEYEDAARKLAIGDISPPVETQFGIHIIQVLERKGEKTRSRHILIPISAGDRDRDSVVAMLGRLRDSALAGADFGDLARRHSQDPDTRGLGGSLGKIQLESLPAAQKEELEKMKIGDVTEPMPAALSPTENGYQIIRIARIIPKHTVDLVEDRGQIERMALLYKQNRELASWIDQLREEIYWDIKHTF